MADNWSPADSKQQVLSILQNLAPHAISTVCTVLFRSYRRSIQVKLSLPIIPRFAWSSFGMTETFQYLFFTLQYVKWSSTARGSTLNILTSGLFGESGEPDAFFTDEKCRSMFKAHMMAMVNRRWAPLCSLRPKFYCVYSQWKPQQICKSVSLGQSSLGR